MKQLTKALVEQRPENGRGADDYFSPEIRKAVYTTNAIESVNYTIQKIIKHRQSFPNDEAAMKLIFMRETLGAC
jgi:transposase-like protein